jgi:hypothetical protein
MQSQPTRAGVGLSRRLRAPLLVGACVVASALTQAAPAQATQRHLTREMRPLCQLKHVPSPIPHTYAGIVALCSDRANVKPRARASDYVTGNCGASWMYNGKLGTGWIWEYFGVSSNGRYGRIIGGGAIARWYNFTQPQYRNSYGPLGIWGSLDGGYAWDDTHNVYSHIGLIGSWLDAADILSVDNTVCSNYFNEPYDYAWV